MISLSIALISFCIWLVLLFLRGDFWRITVPKSLATGHATPSVVVVIPARDEAENIAETIRSLLAQDYLGGLHIVLVDDHSTDQTAFIAQTTVKQAGAEDRLTIITGQPLEPGWTGKLWAVHQGVTEAQKRKPDFILLTDADITHAPDNISQLVARAIAQNLDLTSLMVLLNCQSFYEKATIPAFVFFFFMLYPPKWIAGPSQTAGAAGGCMLVRTAMLERIGGIQIIRDKLIDDCSLAAAVKQAGGRLWLGATTTTFSTRAYSNLQEVWSMIARTAFTQLNYKTYMLALTLIGLSITYIAPPLFSLFGHGVTQIMSIIVWLAMATSFQPILKLYRRSPAWGFALPLIAIFYAAATFGSAWNYWNGKGGQWKGRAQAISGKPAIES